MELAQRAGLVALVKTLLGPPSEVTDPLSVSLLTLGQSGADLGWIAVVGGTLDEDPAGVTVAALGDPALPAFEGAGVFGRDQAEIGHELLGVLETTEGADLRDDDHRRDGFKSLEGHEGVDQRFALPGVEQVGHDLLEVGDPFEDFIDDAEVVLHDEVVHRVGKLELPQIALVGFGPVGLSRVGVAVVTQEGEEAGLGPAHVPDRIGAGPAKIANGLVGAVGDVDRDEIIGPKSLGKFGGVSLVGLDLVSGFSGDERRGDDIAGNAHLEQAPSDPKSASTGLVADVKVAECELLGLADGPHGFFKSVLGGSKDAELLGIIVALGAEQSGHGLFFMYVESDVEFFRCV